MSDEIITTTEEVTTPVTEVTETTTTETTPEVVAEVAGDEAPVAEVAA